MDVGSQFSHGPRSRCEYLWLAPGSRAHSPLCWRSTDGGHVTKIWGFECGASASMPYELCPNLGKPLTFTKFNTNRVLFIFLSANLAGYIETFKSELQMQAFIMLLYSENNCGNYKYKRRFTQSIYSPRRIADNGIASVQCNAALVVPVARHPHESAKKHNQGALQWNTYRWR